MPSNRIASLPVTIDNFPQKQLSLIDILAAGVSTPIQFQETLPISDSFPPFDDDYRNIPTTEERLLKAHSLFQRNVLNPFEDSASTSVVATPENLKGELKSFLSAHQRKGLTSAETDELCHDIIVKIATEKKKIDPFRVMKVFCKFCLSSFDTITDILITITLSATSPMMAIVQGGALFFSFVVQSIMSHILGQPLWVVLSGLFGTKPLVEAWRDATNAKPFPGQKQGNDFMLFLSRMIEITTEAIPQSLIQTLTLIVVPVSRTPLGYISLFSSFATTGFLVASSDREIDTSKTRRKFEPLFFGYVPEENSNRQMVACTVFFATYKAAKVASLSLLVASSSFSYAAILIVTEMMALLGWRKSYENLRVYRRGADGIIPSLLCHLCFYIALVAAPFPIIRLPTFLTPLIYARGLLYMLGVNFLIVYLSYHVLTPTNTPTTHDIPVSFAWTFLASTTLLCLLSGSVAFHYVPETHKGSFFRHKTFQHHVATFTWNDQTHTTDLSHREIADRDLIRAQIPLWYSDHYIPKALLIAFYKSKWAGWCADPPDWFDDDFKADIPRHLLIEVDESLWGGGGQDT